MRSAIAAALALLLLPLASGASDSPPTQQAFEEACNEASNVGPKMCHCLWTKTSDLTPDAVSFLIAGYEQDDAETTRLRSKMPIAETMKAGMFHVNASRICAEELEKAGEKSED
jgi:hypothetical protein